MNKYNREAINNFVLEANTRMLWGKLITMFPEPYVVAYLRNTFIKHVGNYSQMLEREFLNTEILNRGFRNRGQDIPFEVGCINMQFLDYMKDFITLNVMKTRIPTSNPVFYNDALNSSARSSVDNCNRQRLCDQNTRDIDDPETFFMGKPSTSSILYGNNQKFSRRAGSDSANDILDRTWYAYRAPQIRDDPVGEIVRDQTPANKQISHGNSNERPQSGRTEGFTMRCDTPQQPHNHVSNRLNDNLGLNGTPSYKATYDSRPFSDQNTVQNKFHNLPSYTTMSQQSIHNAEYANVAIGGNFSFDGNADSNELGSYQNKFTGEEPEYSCDHLDRLLTTPLIQALNSGSNCIDDLDSTSIYDGSTISDPKTKTLRTTYQRGVDGYADVTVRGLQQTEDPQALKLWRDGDSVVDQSDPDCMKEFMNRRVFRSPNNGKNLCKACENDQCSIHTPAQKVINTLKSDDSDAQIPFWEKALYKRQYERSVDENLGGFETTGMQRGYGKDITSMLCRVPSKVPCGDGRYATDISSTIERDISPGEPEWSFQQ